MDCLFPRKSQDEEALEFKRPNIIRVAKSRAKDLRVQGINCLSGMVLETRNKAMRIYDLSHVLEHILSR